ncbi:GntR family transcriptional regulator [Streptomyces tauricus]
MADARDNTPRRSRVNAGTQIAGVLRGELADLTWARGEVRRACELVSRFQTTAYVISTAVQQLGDDGLVEVRTGGGGGIAPSGTTPAQWREAARRGTHRPNIEEAVRRRIGDGTYPVGALLPSTATLAAEFGVGKSTISLALVPFRQQGVLTSAGPSPRDGTLVATPLPAGADPVPTTDRPHTAAPSTAGPVHDHSERTPHIEGVDSRA